MTTALDTSAAASGCEHLPHMRRLIDGESVCTTCGMVVNTNNPAAYPRDRPGAVAPEPRAGGLRHLDPASYTPPQLEQEILDTLDRLERGAGFLVSKQEERSTAHMAYELAYARAIVRSSSRSADQRKAEAMLACEQLWTAWQVLDQVCKTTAEGLHNLRAKESGLQSVLRSVTQAMRSAGQGFTP